MARRKRESYAWTDSEVDFLLENTLDFTKAASFVAPLVLSVAGEGLYVFLDA